MDVLPFEKVPLFHCLIKLVFYYLKCRVVYLTQTLFSLTKTIWFFHDPMFWFIDPKAVCKRGPGKTMDLSFFKVLWSLLNECFHTLEASKGLVLDYVGILRLNVFWRSSIGWKGQNLVIFRIYSCWISLLYSDELRQVWWASGARLIVKNLLRKIVLLKFASLYRTYMHRCIKRMAPI